jgi:hypothetical protein
MLRQDSRVVVETSRSLYIGRAIAKSENVGGEGLGRMTLVARSHDPHVLATPSSNAARASAAEKPQPAAPRTARAAPRALCPRSHHASATLA